MKGLVIYKGKYGASKQYAMWIGQELRLPVASADRFPVDELAKYDYFILGSSVYIGKLEIRRWLKNNFTLLRSKKIFFFQVAASPTEEIEKRESYNKASLPPLYSKRYPVLLFTRPNDHEKSFQVGQVHAENGCKTYKRSGREEKNAY